VLSVGFSTLGKSLAALGESGESLVRRRRSTDNLFIMVRAHSARSRGRIEQQSARHAPPCSRRTAFLIARCACGARGLRQHQRRHRHAREISCLPARAARHPRQRGRGRRDRQREVEPRQHCGPSRAAGSLKRIGRTTSLQSSNSWMPIALRQQSSRSGGSQL
jgi:hypothetical protein